MDPTPIIYLTVGEEVIEELTLQFKSLCISNLPFSNDYTLEEILEVVSEDLENFLSIQVDLDEDKILQSVNLSLIICLTVGEEVIQELTLQFQSMRISKLPLSNDYTLHTG